MAVDPILLNDWHAIAAVRDLKPESITSVRLLGENLLLWRCGDRFMVWQDYCPHRGARLSMGQITNETLVCPYHGLAYNTVGECVHIPAHPNQQPPTRMHVTSYPCVEHYGFVWVCLGDIPPLYQREGEPKPITLPPFPEWDDPSYRKFLCGPYGYRSSGFRAIENFLDVSHLPFVHDGLLGDRDRTAVEDYQVQTHPDGISLVNVRVWQPDPDGTGAGGKVTYNYRVWRPLTTSFVKEAQGGKLAIFFTVSPVEEEECLGWMWIAMNYGHDIPEADLRAFQDKVVHQDIPIVESQQPKRLPLDLQAEVHLTCDRASIAYRKWLNQLGVTFGTL